LPESVGDYLPAVAKRKFGDNQNMEIKRSAYAQGYGAPRKIEIGSLRTAITIQPYFGNKESTS
jgi:hypothetical protein